MHFPYPIQFRLLLISFVRLLGSGHGTRKVYHVMLRQSGVSYINNISGCSRTFIRMAENFFNVLSYDHTILLLSYDQRILPVIFTINLGNFVLKFKQLFLSAGPKMKKNRHMTRSFISGRVKRSNKEIIFLVFPVLTE